MEAVVPDQTMSRDTVKLIVCGDQLRSAKSVDYSTSVATIMPSRIANVIHRIDIGPIQHFHHPISKRNMEDCKSYSGM